MIIVLFGQPHSGKTTLANELCSDTCAHHVDGDALRDVFKNKDFSREGRIKNLNRASDIAVYLDATSNCDVILSLVYPYKEARDYLNSLTEDVKWIHLEYAGERGREAYHVKDFELPSPEATVLPLSTSQDSIEECVNKIKQYVGKESTR